MILLPGHGLVFDAAAAARTTAPLIVLRVWILRVHTYMNWCCLVHDNFPSYESFIFMKELLSSFR